MTIKKSQLRKFGDAIRATQPQKKKGYFAVLGTLTGEVLTGVSNLVYITTFEGQTLTVINRRVPNRPGSVVFVGSDDYSANRIEILYTLNAEGTTNDGSSADSIVGVFPPHSHSADSLDPTWVYDSQFTPLLVLPISGTLTVQVYPGAIRKTSSAGWKYIADQVVDLSGDMPASGACWALLQANDDGTVDAVVGSTQANRASLTETDIPDATTGKGIVAIVLEAGYTELYRNNARNDFLDLRFDKAGGGGSSDAAAVTYTPGDVNDWDYLADPGNTADALDQLADRVASAEAGNYTDEQAQDAVGAMLADTATIDLTYTDETPELKADVKADSITNSLLANMAVNTIKGRKTAGTGDPEDLSAADVRTLLELTPASDPWIAPTLEGTWVNSGGTNPTAGYYKDVTGRVWIRGVVKDGTSTSAVWYLPAGYRPAADVYWWGFLNGAIAIMAVQASDGKVFSYTAGNQNLVFDYSFLAA